MNIISHYNLDSNANDSKSVYNGTATNVTYVAGIRENAGSFNGASSFITTTYINNGDQWISMWVNPTSTGTDRAFIGDNSGASNFLILVNNAGKLSIRNSIGTFWNETGTSVVNGTWQHFIFFLRLVESPPTVYNAYVDIYKNNAFVQTLTVGGSGNLWFNSGTIIGRNSLTSYYYGGLMDHITIGSGTLTLAERTFLYGGGIPPRFPFSAGFFQLF